MSHLQERQKPYIPHSKFSLNYHFIVEKAMATHSSTLACLPRVQPRTSTKLEALALIVLHLHETFLIMSLSWEERSISWAIEHGSALVGPTSAVEEVWQAGRANVAEHSAVPSVAIHHPVFSSCCKINHSVPFLTLKQIFSFLILTL